MLNMKEGESVNDYFAHNLTIVNKLWINMEKMDDVKIIKKILRSMRPKFNYMVCFIEELKDLDALIIDELQRSLLVYEQRMKPYEIE